MPLFGSLVVPGILVWLLATGTAAFAAMGLDKAMARFRWGTRVSEKTLWLMALAGGFLGIIVGAITFHHKTSKGGFWPPVALAVLVWVAILVLILTGHLPAKPDSI
jgi:uncharacterized membrane protein YsdA (DUF1294 family)